jgi:acetylornithine/succinyldiaminopimelate/putrescine aminotransferase
LPIQSYWPAHTPALGGQPPPQEDAENPVDARRCTVQLSTGRLYLDALATPATALLGHDLPPTPAVDEATVQQMLSSLAPGYACVAMTQTFSAAADLAAQIGEYGSLVEINAIAGEPASAGRLLVALENETLGRTGRWLASSAWKHAADIIVVGEALALGSSFGAVLAREGFAAGLDLANRASTLAYQPASPESLARLSSAIHAVENEGLVQQGRDVANYLMARLAAVRESCPQIESVEGTGLSIRVTLASPHTAAQIRRGMCERGVLAGADGPRRLAINPPLPLRIAEADVITGALRGALLGLPLPSAPVCCAACDRES